MINIPDIEGLDPVENREMRQVIMSGLVDMGVVPGSSNSYSRDRERLILQSLVDNIERYTDLADSRHHSEMPNLVNSHQSIEVPSSDEPFTSETISSVRAEDNDPVPRDVGYTEDQTSVTNFLNGVFETEVSIGDCSDEE